MTWTEEGRQTVRALQEIATRLDQIAKHLDWIRSILKEQQHTATVTPRAVVIEHYPAQGDTLLLTAAQIVGAQRIAKSESGGPGHWEVYTGYGGKHRLTLEQGDEAFPLQ